MVDKCVWPRCRADTAGAIRAGGKTYRLCNYHGDMVQDTDVARMKRARSKLHMPIPKKIRGYVVTEPEMCTARCACLDCGYPVSLAIYTNEFPEGTRGVPCCNLHYSRVADEGLPGWDGVWHRFIPGCGLAPSPLFEENTVKAVEAAETPLETTGKTLEEVFEETEPTEREEELTKSLMDRLASGDFDFDAPEE